MTENLKPRTAFAISGFKQFVVIIDKLQEISSFEIRHLEGHLPSVDNVVTFQFFAKVL